MKEHRNGYDYSGCKPADPVICICNDSPTNVGKEE
jgi:hypothetical protein